MCTFHHPEVGLRANAIRVAESLVEQAEYCYLSEECQPPETINCGMLARWVFSQVGIWGNLGLTAPKPGEKLLLNLKKASTLIAKPLPGDLVFIQQEGREYEHVGILAFDDVIIHACSQRGTVVADPFNEFWRNSAQPPYYISLLENHAGITPQNAEQYLRGELSSEATKAIEDHFPGCDRCEPCVELTRRYTHWESPEMIDA